MQLDGVGPLCRSTRDRWFRPRALRNLGVAHFVGRGVERDPSAAYGWFWLAARSGSAMAAPDAAHVASLLGEERTAEARLVALRWELAVSESPQEHRQ